MEVASLVVFLSLAGSLVAASAACLLALPACSDAHAAEELQLAPRQVHYAPLRIGTDASLFNNRVMAKLRRHAAWRAWAAERDRMFALPDGPTWRQHRAALKLYPEELVRRVLRKVRLQMARDGELPPPPAVVPIGAGRSFETRSREALMLEIGHTHRLDKVGRPRRS